MKLKWDCQLIEKVFNTCGGSKPSLFSSIRTSVLRGCNTLSEFQEFSVIPGMKVVFSTHESSSKLNGIFL